ncbi:MAG: cupin domain-containing protein [Hyphomonadaceae bacterium]|nr:cupin domain-containing protein [Hyphomonadaceae bacterium]
MRQTTLGAAFLALAACQPSADEHYSAAPQDIPRPPPGSNEQLRAPITIADGLEVIISDVVIPPGAQVPRHYHPGEEFLYVIEGSAVHVQEGQPDIILSAGDSYVIPPQAVHSPYAGEAGARAVVFRVHTEGEPERTLVETPDETETP